MHIFVLFGGQFGSFWYSLGISTHPIVCVLEPPFGYMDKLNKMASKSKKLRIRYHNDHFEIEKEDNVKQKLDFLPSMISLCSSNYLLQTTLTPVKILNCNAAASVPSSFSKVFCDIEYYGKDSFVFGDAFRTGMDILGDYFIRNSMPKNRQFLSVFEKLLYFIDGGGYTLIS